MRFSPTFPAPASQSIPSGRLTIAAGGTVNLGQTGLQGSYYSQANEGQIASIAAIQANYSPANATLVQQSKCRQSHQRQRDAVRLRRRR